MLEQFLQSVIDSLDNLKEQVTKELMSLKTPSQDPTASTTPPAKDRPERPN